MVEIGPDLRAFWRERHLCTVTTLRRDGSPHVTPMGIVLEPEQGLAWGITSGGSQKVRNVEATGRIAVCQVDGRRWSTLEGTATVLRDPEAVRAAVARYAERYREPRENPARVTIRIEVERVLGNVR